MKIQPLSLLSILALLTACEPTVANRGSMLEPEVLSQITPGQTTREEVASQLGTPTAISTFDDKVWYYAGRQTEQYSFFMPDVVKQQCVEVVFDNNGVVTALNNLDLSNAADLDPVNRSTPTYGQKNTLIRELLGDLSHPGLARKERRSGTD